jgi:hypothetical protein
MAPRIRTLNFLPEIFKTPTNSQFLGATLDQLVAQPNTKKIEGYVGSKLGYGINATDYYVTEPTKTRTDYQLDPGVVFTKDNESTARDFISYPGIVDGLLVEGGITGNNNRLFQSQFYSWDSFTNLDKIINFSQYYWLPEGPAQVSVNTATVYNNVVYDVIDTPTVYVIAPPDQVGTSNPTITLLRGGSYQFIVNQASQFWIQGVPGVTGYSPLQPSMQTRDVYGVANNGAAEGVVTFNVPSKDAQDNYNIPGNLSIDLVTSTPFNQIDGQLLKDLPDGIDGVTAIEGLVMMFYNTSSEYGYINKYYDTTSYDENGGIAYDANTDFPGSSIYDNNFEGGYYTDLTSTFYQITYIGDPENPQIRLVEYGTIPTYEKITPKYGTVWINRNFFKNNFGSVELIPYISAPLDTLYYQDGTNPDKVGVIRLIEDNVTNTINVETEILGKKNYTATNGVVFTNGLKVAFQGSVFPESYKTGQYYVEGVGTAIELIAVADLISPELGSSGAYVPFDSLPFDVGNFDTTLYVPITPDYITIARNSLDRNAWSRSNRWFHIDVINATATYNNTPSYATSAAIIANKAKRPIIEFYPNLRLFNTGVLGKKPIDFMDTRTTDALTLVSGQQNYYPDVAAYSAYNATITPVTGPITGLTVGSTNAVLNSLELSAGDTSDFHVNDSIVFSGTPIGGVQVTSPVATVYYIHSIIDSTQFTISTERNGEVFKLTSGTGSMDGSLNQLSTEITVAASSLFGNLQVGQYIVDSTMILPTNAFVSAIAGTSTLTITVSWNYETTVASTSVASIVTAPNTLDNYNLYEGARVVFSADTNINVRNKIYVVHFSSIAGYSAPIITLTEAEDGLVLTDEQIVAYRGYNYAGQSFHYNGIDWDESQVKTSVNQPPKFDIFDGDGISLGNRDFYVGSSFVGTTLFEYAIGSGINDIVLGFPLSYSSVDNVGDIKFDVTLNSDTFNYVTGTQPVTQSINVGYVYQYESRTAYIRRLGWETAVSPSIQYQVFDFDYDPSVSTNNVFICDIPMSDVASTNWPTIQVFINNVYQDPSSFTYTVTDTETQVTVNVTSLTKTVVQVLLLSDNVSKTAYYDIPINLNNNPLNQNLTSVNVGDVRGQYQSIFYNNPNTTGVVFGSNNFRDLGNIVPWGSRIIQNSAPLVLPGAFLRNQNHSLFNALQYNSTQYINFKALLIDTANNTAYASYQNPANMLDQALAQLALSKTETESFFWSDMLPSKAAYITNSYSFANSLDVSRYALSRVYDFTSANYYGVLVYLTRTTTIGTTITQLIRNVDYTVSTDSTSLTVTTDLDPGDIITINEYNQTYGSYVPNTPTKLGLYPATIPSVVLDSNYAQPTYFIVGHDGSYTRLYGTYDDATGQLSDYRDQILLEFEKRVYNNLKLSNVIPIQAYEVTPGFFRDTDYSFNEVREIYSQTFLNWVGQNRIEYKQQLYNKYDAFTYNYRSSGNAITQEPIEQGYWRGLNLYFFDTSTPQDTPWEMIGYTTQPSWWTARYGVAPYTIDNLVLWDDMANGIDWNNGVPIVIEKYKRPNLLEVLPIDTDGNLLAPLYGTVGNYTDSTFRRDWIVGDCGPAEFSYRRSSSYPFDLMRIMALTKPAQFFNLAVNVDVYKYNIEFNQYLVNNRTHLLLSDIKVYGTGTPVTSYINWIVDYEKQVGIDATTNIQTLLDNLDVRLVYRLAGFSDKAMLKFYVEKGSPNSRNSSLLIPDESYSVLLYDNQPFDRITYSSVVVQITASGYKVYGNSQTTAFFKTLAPKINGSYDKFTVGDLSVQVAKNYSDTVVSIPYGVEFYTVQEVAQFLMSYGKYLEFQGVLFETIENGIQVNWPQMVNELLYWAQLGWDVGSIATINPSANTLVFDKDSCIVQPLTLRQQNFVLNQNLMPIDSTSINVLRDSTLFSVSALNPGDSISYSQFNISNIEHGIVFDNVTLFNDVIYNLITGLRQIRIIVRGTKTAEWNGTVDAQGFILNQDNIQAWSKETKYTTGQIVKYKNKYWIAIKVIQAKEVFDEQDWKVTDYNEIQKGLLPNSSTRSYESTIYYNINQANLENDADLLSFSLIGYRPRDYLALADLTDITQVNVYKNLLRNKGTLDAANAFKGATLANGGIDYTISENWAIKSGQFGGVLNSNFIDIKLNESMLSGNPSIVGLTNGIYTDGVQQEVPLYSLYNYSNPVTSPDVLSTVDTEYPSTLYPTAGFVNFNDVKASSYYYSGLSNATNQFNTPIPLTEMYVKDYVWLANYLEKWQVMSLSSIGGVSSVTNNLNGTATITFKQEHNLSLYQIFALVNLDPLVNGYYVVTTIVNQFKVLVNSTLPPSTLSLTGNGIGLSFQSQRVTTPASIYDLPLLTSEFVKNKVWVDTDTDGSWTVYRKSLNYVYESEVVKDLSSTFGSVVAYEDNLGYLVGDSVLGKVYRYTYNALTQVYLLAQTITQDTSFGSSLSYTGNTYVISEPTSGSPAVYIYKLEETVLVNLLVLDQTIAAPVGVTNWGSSIAISGDENWLYISAIEDDEIYVYVKSQISEQYELHTTLTSSLVDAGSQMGYSIATTYYGETVIAGAPNQAFDPSGVNLSNWGSAVVWDRLIQNLETPYNSSPYVPVVFTLVSPPATIKVACSATITIANTITASSTSGMAVNDPVVFTGTILSAGAIAANTVYYIKTIVPGNKFTISATRGGTQIALVSDSTGTMYVNVQTEEVFVSVNGTLLTDAQYAVVDTNSLNIYSNLIAGDIVNVSTSNFSESQLLTTQTTPRVGVKFGTSVDTTTHSSEILVGAPYELNSANAEGAVFRYTNAGAKYGSITGTSVCAVTTNRVILLNGFAVTLTSGNASHVAALINAANITNIQASATTGILTISLIDVALAIPNDKLSLIALDGDALSEMGINLYTQTQTVICPHPESRSQFGTVVKFNEYDSFVTSAPVGTRYASTTFDFADDENYDDDTLFDNNATQWIDTFANAGAVYMFDYLPEYNENISNVGKFVYAQSLNAKNEEYGSQPYYGTAINFSNYNVIIGTPGFKPSTVGGQVVIYRNTVGEKDWSPYRRSGPVVDTAKIDNVQMYSASTNQTLINLDYIDPLQSKLLGAVSENIDVVSNVDPASYTVSNNQKAIVWGSSKVGHIWFNTSNTRFVNYHQTDIVYNSKWWGQIFPGSDVSIYSWISSPTPPISYAGPGTPYDVTSYSVESVINQAGTLTPVYFFWVRNTNIVFEKVGKTLADSTLESYIVNPKNSGISYFSALTPGIYALYNSYQYVNYTDSILHIGYSSGTNDDVPHNLYSLIRTNYADDFLPGLPKTTSTDVPTSLYDTMLDSLAGVDEAGQVVPNPFLPKPVQSGILVRPRQSFFYNRFNALKNYLEFANTVLLQYPITETRRTTFLFRTGEFYNTPDYWEYANWWVAGYNDNTKAALRVQIYADLSTINVAYGTIVTVLENGSGSSETYIYSDAGTWDRIGLTNGTIQFKSSLWDYASAKLGFGDNFFDTTVYDLYPSEETRYIVRSLNEEIYTNDLAIYRNKSLILLFEYIQSESIENENYLPWLNKTSFVDVSHTIRELRPIEVYQNDNQEFLAGYLNEAKPYHVVIKEFVFKYTGIDVYEGDITDFDLPAKYNSEIDQFVTPELVFSKADGITTFLPTATIWQEPEYTQWFANAGLGITGQPNYTLTTLASYIALNSNAFAVDNASGFPINGVLKIDDEYIGYSSVDRARNIVSGLTRGVNQSDIATHIPGQSVVMDLPAVLLLNGGRLYANPPKVTAYIDTSIYPEPTRPAVLSAVMNLDSVLQIDVIDPGEGYFVLPKIVIEPSVTVTFPSTSVNTKFNTIQVYAPTFRTGDLVTYTVGADTTNIGGLQPGQYYYIGLIETVPTLSIALYSTYYDAINDTNRLTFFNAGLGSNNRLNLGALASCVSSALPIRENTITLNFDRTSYNHQVTIWEPGNYYGSYFAGALNSTESTSASSITLYDTKPPISNILASAQGVAFEIVDATNDRQLTWSSRTRTVLETYQFVDKIRIGPSDGGSNVTSELGSTLGFYVGMPIKFEGQAFSTLSVYKTYYVKSLEKLSGLDTGITISETITDGVPGPALALTNAVAPPAGLRLYVGNVVDTAVLTIDYPGINPVTSTQSGTNAITCPITISGNSGTSGMYSGIPIFFTGAVFGNIIENETYYVLTIIDLERFTIAKTATAKQITITAINGSTNAISCENTSILSVNEPVIFNEMMVAGAATTTFGNLVSGTTYYVREIFYGNTTFTVSTQINGSVFDVATVVAASDTMCTGTSQYNAVQLETATGNMTANINLPVSPGQINGQLFTLYNSETYVPGFNLVPNNLISLLIVRVLANTVNRIVLDESVSVLDNLYNNLQFRVSANIGGLVTGTTYYVIDSGVTTIVVTNTASTNNALTCTNTAILYANMPIVFSGMSLGGVLISVQYYVKTILTSTTFTISASVGGAAFTLFNDNGTMTGTGQPFVKVSSSLGGSSVSLTAASSTTTLINQYINDDQYINDVATVAVGSQLGGYTVVIEDQGASYAIDNQIVISGSLLGGIAGTNDLTLTINTIDEFGAVTSIIRSGTPIGAENQYYLKVISGNQVEVYSNGLMTLPVSGINFPYRGIISTTVTETASGTDYITVDSSDSFDLYQPVIFTGEVFGGLELGVTYYVLDKPDSTTLVVSSQPAGAAVTLTDDTGSCSVATHGEYALLPEPFFFNQSIVKYNNRVYRCVISNNDPEFIIGKWELLRSDNKALNALDRIIGYYQPTIDMPGVDLTQLVEGITYPNPTYYGNAFAPADEYQLDTILQDYPFYPQNVRFKSVIWHNGSYLSVADAQLGSLFTNSELGSQWEIVNYTNNELNLTDIARSGSYYVATSDNNATPIVASTDGIVWFVPGQPIPNVTTVVESNSLSSVAGNGNLFVAVGENIVTSNNNIYNWNQTYQFTNVISASLNGVAYVNINNYAGFIAVGVQQLTGTSDPRALILLSVDGYIWNNPIGGVLTTEAFNSATSGGNIIVVVGDNGSIFVTTNGSNWSNVSVSAANLNDVYFDGTQFIAVGDDGTILTSDDGLTWVEQTSGTTETLTSVVYNPDEEVYAVVGYNIILVSLDTVNWTKSSVLIQAPTAYTVDGGTFTSGYGPEELVPGVVTDMLMMTVATRPGTNWDPTIYQSVGYNVVSREIKASFETQTLYSFLDVVQTVFGVQVYVIDSSTGLSTTLYPTEYTIDWIAEAVILDSPISLLDTLRIDVYEVGNGDQLVKSNTKTDPLRLNTTTGFTEIFVNCNYTGTIYNGSGAVRPGTQPVETTASATYAINDTITVDNIDQFVLNNPIKFSGAVFGGIVEDQVYYVKTISQATGSITVSEDYNFVTGTAGITFELDDAVGSMNVIIQIGSGTPWTEPVVYYNGTKLVSGITTTVTRTKAAGNTITCNNTSTFIVGEHVVFSDSMFGSDIVPGTKYYIQSIVDANEFTVSETSGGPVLTLSDATGGAIALINDYAFGIQPNGISAKLVFAGKTNPEDSTQVIPYVQNVDYITYTIFGETSPTQYGYTVPQTEFFTGDNVETTFNLANYVNGDNPDNAIVEIDGVRQTQAEYTIDPLAKTIEFTTAPADNVVIAVTTYNFTDYQYFNTQFGITGVVVANITAIDTALQVPLASTEVTTATASTDALTALSTVGFVVGQVVELKAEIIEMGILVSGKKYVIQSVGTTNFTTLGASSNTVGVVFTCNSNPQTGSGTVSLSEFGGVSLLGTVYYVDSVPTSTTFKIKDQYGTLITLADDSGVISAQVGGISTTRVTTGIAHDLSENTLVCIDGVNGSGQLNNNLYYVHVINDNQVDLYLTPYNSAYNAINDNVIGVSTYIGSGFIWESGLFTLYTTVATATSSSNNRLTVGSTSNLIVNTPVIFTESGKVAGDTTLGNLVVGTTYYVKEIVNGTTFTVSSTHGGANAVVLTTSSGTMYVSQWEQVNPDRLWITIDGYRVPSSSIRINPDNNINILTTIVSGNEIIITNMIPTATPNEEVYLLQVSQTQRSLVYRANTMTRTWLTANLDYTDEVIYLNDVTRVTNTIVQNVITPTEVDNRFSIGLLGDKRIITGLKIYNATKDIILLDTSYIFTIVDLTPTVIIQNGTYISEGDDLVITIVEGNTIYINGEFIRFGTADLINNTLSNLQRGANGSGRIPYISQYSEVFGLISSNQMVNSDYNLTWNSDTYDTILGDPLQISTTNAAIFLRTDVT